MSSESYHEPYEELTAETRDMHRAIESLMEARQVFKRTDQIG